VIDIELWRGEERRGLIMRMSPLSYEELYDDLKNTRGNPYLN